MLKNTAGQFFHAIAFDVNGRVSGQAANITSGLSIDGGTRVATNDVNPTEIGATGEYAFALTQPESNGHALSFTPACSTSGVQVLGSPSNVIYTTVNANDTTGDWAIRRTFEIGSSDVPGVQMSLVGVAGKVDVTGSDGIAQINTDNGTFTLRVTVPFGYVAVSDVSVTINGADSIATITLVREAVPTLVSSTGTLIRRPSVSRRGTFLTLAGVVDHLLSVEEINPSEARSVDRAIVAAQSALQSLTSYSTQGFRYYQGRSKMVMPGTVSLGTVSVNSGLVTGTFTLPSWVDLSHIRVGARSYAVLGVDGLGGFFVDATLIDGSYAAVVMEQVFFQLPKDFRRRGRIADRANQLDIEDLSGSVLQSLSDHLNWVNSSGRNRSFAAITVDQRFQGDLMLAVWPPYGTRTELDLFYERYPAAVDVHRTSIASLSVTGQVATAATGVFTDRHVNTALTIGTTNDIEVTKPLSSLSLVDSQRVILKVNSATEVLLDAAVSDAGVTNRAAYISDIVDVLRGPMAECYLRLAEYELLRQARHKSAQLRQREFMEQLAIAMTDDARHRESPGDMNRNEGGHMMGAVNYR